MQSYKYFKGVLVRENVCTQFGVKFKCFEFLKKIFSRSHSSSLSVFQKSNSNFLKVFTTMPPPVLPEGTQLVFLFCLFAKPCALGPSLVSKMDVEGHRGDTCNLVNAAIHSHLVPLRVGQHSSQTLAKKTRKHMFVYNSALVVIIYSGGIVVVAVIS